MQKQGFKSFIDSQSALKAFVSPLTTSKLFQQCKSRLDFVGKYNELVNEGYQVNRMRYEALESDVLTHEHLSSLTPNNLH